MVTPPKSQSTRGVGKRSAADRAARPRTGGRSARVVTEVLSAALEVFAEQGYAGLSIEAVALRAGVNKTTVYRRWPAKADLVGAALASLRDADPEPPDTGSLREDLLQVLRHWAVQMVTPRRRAIMQSLLLGNTDPEMQAIVRRMRAERPAIPAVIFERALERRELPKGSDQQLIAAALLGPLHSRAFWKRESIDDGFIRALVKLVVTGALAGGAKRA
jgi:AcrR family transcriptional regulator